MSAEPGNTTHRWRVSPWLGRSVGLSLLLLAGCKVGPDFSSPEPPKTDGYVQGEQVEQTVDNGVEAGAAQHFHYGQAVPVAWWRSFRSPALDTLVQQALDDSPDLAAAAARLRQAGASLRAAKGLLFPFVDLTGNATRQRSLQSGLFGGLSGLAAGATGGLNSGSLNSTGGAGSTGTGSTGSTTPQISGSENSLFTIVTASAVITYNLDLFGRERREIEAQAAQQQFAFHELQAAYLALVNNIVSTAVAQARLRGQINAREELIAAQEGRLDITRAQVARGAEAEAAIATARADLAVLRIPLPALQQDIVVADNRLALLSGRAPGLWSPPRFSLNDLHLPEDLPVELPSSLVRRRPDILAAEARLRAANARVGVRTADLYPDIALSGSYGLGAIGTGISSLAFSPFWSIGPSVLFPLIHGGRLRAERDAAIADYEAVAADYRRTVLNAFAEVANALRALQNDALLLQAAREAVAASRYSVGAATARYRGGIANYTEVLIAQQQQQQAVLSEVDAIAARFQDTTALFSALGGGLTDTPVGSAAAVRPVSAPR